MDVRLEDFKKSLFNQIKSAPYSSQLPNLLVKESLFREVFFIWIQQFSLYKPSEESAEEIWS